MNAAGAPCQQPASNAETTQCVLSAVKHADEDLNRTYVQIRKILGSDDLRKFEDAERILIQYRDATCMAERDLYRNGTGAPSRRIRPIPGRRSQTPIDIGDYNL